MFRKYQTLPTHDPKSIISMESLSNVKPTLPLEQASAALYALYPNYNTFKLGQWYWADGAQKSQYSFQSLLKVVGDKGFNPDDVRGVNWASINSCLGLNDWDGDDGWEDADAGWHVSSVTIEVPFHRNSLHPGVREFTVKSFYRHSLVSVIREKLELKVVDIPHFHLEPFELMWRPGPQEEPTRLHGEIYTSSSFLKAHEDLQASPPEPSCTLPRYVVALMFWSDGTHLTDFGTASLTPLYMQYGNKSKYRRCKPTMHLTDHVAYFEELPDEFKAWSSQYLGKNKTNSEFLSHCRRELTHAQWRLLLDDDFINTYQHGLVVQWEDGISRRFYPRIFCYSADYKEKALMATVRMNGLVPCPCCKVLKAAAHLVGTKKDKKDRVQLERLDEGSCRTNISEARNKIYKENHKVDSAHVKCLLMPESLVPTV
ncbi:hypothetical protein DXG01_011609, partial [Tephrocybe rancida]